MNKLKFALLAMIFAVGNLPADIPDVLDDEVLPENHAAVVVNTDSEANKVRLYRIKGITPEMRTFSKLSPEAKDERAKSLMEEVKRKGTLIAEYSMSDEAGDELTSELDKDISSPAWFRRWGYYYYYPYRHYYYPSYYYGYYYRPYYRWSWGWGNYYGGNYYGCSWYW